MAQIGHDSCCYVNNKGNFEVLCEIGIKIRVVNVDWVAITFVYPTLLVGLCRQSQHTSTQPMGRTCLTQGRLGHPSSCKAPRRPSRNRHYSLACLPQVGFGRGPSRKCIGAPAALKQLGLGGRLSSSSPLSYRCLPNCLMWTMQGVAYRATYWTQMHTTHITTISP